MWQISWLMILVDRVTNFMAYVFWLTQWQISWLMILVDRVTNFMAMILVDRVTNFMAHDFSWPCDKFHGICFWLTQWQISWLMILVDRVTNFVPLSVELVQEGHDITIILMISLCSSPPPLPRAAAASSAVGGGSKRALVAVMALTHATGKAFPQNYYRWHCHAFSSYYFQGMDTNLNHGRHFAPKNINICTIIYYYLICSILYNYSIII